MIFLLNCGSTEVLVGRDGQAGTAGEGGAGQGQGGAGENEGGAGGNAGVSGTSGQNGSAGQGEELCGAPGSQAPCEVDAFCDHEDKACGRVDAGSACKPRPSLSVCPTECNPICACDGVVYCNECYANNAGTDADPDGSCP